MEDISRSLREALLARGAALVGYADLTRLPPGPRKGLPRGVAIAMAMDPGIAASLAEGPSPEYKREYDRLNEALGGLARLAAEILKSEGHTAEAKAATHSEIDWDALETPLPHKTAATLAGLGWIGKNALLVTREHGTAVRLCTVLTDAPLETGAPIESSKCGTCEECARVCPGGAVSGKFWRAGMDRAEFFDAHACHKVTLEREAELGDLICGVCVAACPWTKKSLKKT